MCATKLHQQCGLSVLSVGSLYKNTTSLRIFHWFLFLLKSSGFT